MQKAIRIEILGHQYPLRVAAEDEAFTQRIAAFVDERFRAVRNEVSGVSDLTHAVLGALGMAEELILLREELERLQRRTGSDADALTDRLDAVLDAGEAGGDGASSAEDTPSTNP